MPKYTPASFTKNFSWNHSYKRLHTAVNRGFEGSMEPIARDAWRAHCGIADQNRQLIPMNFFLYSCKGVSDDYLLFDQFVEVAATRPYNDDFDGLALFNFHLAMSGVWGNSKWPDGRVAGWARDFICSAWEKGHWRSSAFEENAMEAFLDQILDAEPVSKRKVLTNYRFMLTSAGLLVDGQFQAPDLRKRWPVDAVQLVWDRNIFDGVLHPSSPQSAFEAALKDQEIFKLLGCDSAQLQAFARAAFREYGGERMAKRGAQIQELRKLGRIAA